MPLKSKTWAVAVVVLMVVSSVLSFFPGVVCRGGKCGRLSLAGCVKREFGMFLAYHHPFEGPPVLQICFSMRAAFALQRAGQ